MKPLLASLMLLACSANVAAQVRPIPGPGDPRLQTIAYLADQVVQLDISSGTAVMVSFAGGERVETIALGDSVGWQVTPTKRGDALFIKAFNGSDSNMTVVTDARTYLFQLSPGGYGAPAPYVIRFTYADTAVPTSSLTPLDDVRYRLQGSRAIRPSAIVASNNNIAISWPKGSTLPAIFRIDDSGVETLVNGEMQDDRFIVEGRPKRQLFRLDRLQATALRVDARKRRP